MQVIYKNTRQTMHTLEHYLNAVQQPFALPASLPNLEHLPRNGVTVMLFSPHPDDECVVGALPLRLRREAHARVINVAVTLGSLESRRAARRQELEKACALLSFECVELAFQPVTCECAFTQPVQWQGYVDAVVQLLKREQPDILIFPHADDYHPAHMGTCQLVRDSLDRMPTEYAPLCVETEFWHALREPNLMVESSAEDLALLLAALACHEGEVARNPYHIRLPAWMIDNTRRGVERVGGFGKGEGASYVFSTLYRVVDRTGKPMDSKMISCSETIGTLEWK